MMKKQRLKTNFEITDKTKSELLSGLNLKFENKKRKKIIKRVTEARNNNRNGKFKEGMLKDLYNDLEKHEDSMGQKIQKNI